MFFSKLKVLAQSRKTVSRFLGLDRQERPAAGSFVAMENLCSDGYPALQTRPRRAVAGTLARPNGLSAKDALIWVDGATLYVGGSAAGLVLSDSPKQLISMGAYLVIWPDRKWINTADLSQFGSLDNETVTSGTVRIALCRADGGDYGSYLVSAASPEQAEDGTLWLDVSGGTPLLRRFSQEEWVTVEDTCVKLSAAGIGTGFEPGDGVAISGCEADGLNGSHVLLQASDDELVITGILSGETTQSEAVTVSRTAPDMDYVVECGNRLWGCKYGVVDGKAVNEIYASKLGDFKNWQCFEGLSTDSYAAARGSDGVFTGAVSYLGYPLFFKEHCIEKVCPSAAGAHQIVTLECPGVKRGSHASLQTVDGTLFYHGAGGVYAFDGSLPVPVSQALGRQEYSGAVAGALQGKYYVTLGDGSGAHHLLVYDSRLGLWHREDGTQAVGFACWGDGLYCLTAGGALLSLSGAGEAETALTWMAETGELGLDAPEHKYLTRLTLQVAPEDGAQVAASVSYDQGRTWEKQGTVSGGGVLQTTLLHLRPRRCAHVRMKLQGTGACTVYSMSAVYEKGSDET